MHALIAKLDATPVAERGLGWKIRAHVTRLAAHLPVSEDALMAMAAEADALAVQATRSCGRCGAMTETAVLLMEHEQTVIAERNAAVAELKRWRAWAVEELGLVQP